MTWGDVIYSKFISLCDKAFEKFVVTVKSKTLKRPWITKGNSKILKKKRRLCDKFLKPKIHEHKIISCIL